MDGSIMLTAHQMLLCRDYLRVRQAVRCSTDAQIVLRLAACPTCIMLRLPHHKDNVAVHIANLLHSHIVASHSQFSPSLAAVVTSYIALNASNSKTAIPVTIALQVHGKLSADSSPPVLDVEFTTEPNAVPMSLIQLIDSLGHKHHQSDQNSFFAAQRHEPVGSTVHFRLPCEMNPTHGTYSFWTLYLEGFFVVQNFVQKWVPVVLACEQRQSTLVNTCFLLC